MSIRTLGMVFLAAVLLASPAEGQRRPESPIPSRTVVRLDGVPQTGGETDRTVELASQAGPDQTASVKSKIGSVALISGGLATMYVAYDMGEEDGGGFGTFVGVLGAAAFWVGVVRLVTR